VSIQCLGVRAGDVFEFGNEADDHSHISTSVSPPVVHQYVYN
jgi:hypothetical protein